MRKNPAWQRQTGFLYFSYAQGDLFGEVGHLMLAKAVDLCGGSGLWEPRMVIQRGFL